MPLPKTTPKFENPVFQCLSQVFGDGLGRFEAFKRVTKNQNNSGLPADCSGQNFNKTIRLELQKISGFFTEKEEELEVSFLDAILRIPPAPARYLTIET